MRAGRALPRDEQASSAVTLTRAGEQAEAIKASLATAMTQLRAAESTEQSAKEMKCAAQTSLSLLAALSVFNSDAVSLLAGIPRVRDAAERLSMRTVFSKLRESSYVSDELAQPTRHGVAMYRTSFTTYVGVGLAIAAASFAVEQAAVGGAACALTTWRMIDQSSREQQHTASKLCSSITMVASQHSDTGEASLAAKEVLAALNDPDWHCASFLCTHVTNLDLKLGWDTSSGAFRLTDASIASLRPLVAVILIAVDERRAQHLRGSSRDRADVKADMMLCIRAQAILERWLQGDTNRVISQARLSLQSKLIGTVEGAGLLPDTIL